MKKYSVEFLGTFFLVLVIALAVKNAGDFAPLAIWSVLMVMIYAWGHVSGAHFNPAVSLAVWLRWKSTVSEMVQYWIAQILWAVVAWFVALFLMDGALSAAAISNSPLHVIIAEIIFTFALAWVVLNVATDDDTAGNSFYGLAIGFTVMVWALSVGAISWWGFNPAVMIGESITGIFAWNTIWMHIVGQLIGGALAAFAYKSVK